MVMRLPTWMEWATSCTHHTSNPVLTSTQTTAIHVDSRGVNSRPGPEYTNVNTTSV